MSRWQDMDLMNKCFRPYWLIGLLLLSGLACAQAGEILTPAEATARALESSTPAADSGRSSELMHTTGPQIGQEATLTGQNFLVNLQAEPDGPVVGGLERGAEVTILDLASYEGQLWYQIRGSTGEGWVRAENLLTIESAGPQPGDKAYLTGVQFLIDLLSEPGGIIIAGQERGAEVIIVEVTNRDGQTWYLVDAPTGRGWLPAENVTVNIP